MLTADELDRRYPITVAMAERIIAETLGKDEQIVDAHALQEALRQDRRVYWGCALTAEFVDKHRSKLARLMEGLDAARGALAEILQQEGDFFVDRLASELCAEDLPIPGQWKNSEQGDHRIEASAGTVQAAACMSRWQSDSDTLSSLARSLYRRGNASKSITNKHASSTSKNSPVNQAGNRLGNGPTVKFIAHGLYITYQLYFNSPITWSNETSTGPSVRFAIKTLEELEIPHPIPGQAFTPSQIVSIWERHHGRSWGQGETKSRKRSARRVKGG